MARQFDRVMVGSIELFVRTAELGSFTKAAAQAGVTQAAVSRAVTRLEERLGVQLFVRSTRSVRLTERGRAYFEQCSAALTQLADAERELTGDQAAPAGLVRCSLPTSYGHHRILPLLPAFLERYPGIEVEVQLSNANIDLVAEGYDFSVRARPQPDSGLVARLLESAGMTLVAAPSYLRRRGCPENQDDLWTHERIQFERPRTGQPVPWLLRKADGSIAEVPVSGRVRITDDVLGVVGAARAGLGIAQVYRFTVEQQLANGELVEVLPALQGAARPFSLLYPKHRHMAHRARLLIDYLVANCAPKVV